jgi:Holliday junction resolvasome RuvABC endonuclease subunit
MNYLALDLGTKTGYAMQCEGERMVAGTWILANGATIKLNKSQRVDRRLDSRIPVLFDALVRTIRHYEIKWMFFEDVQFGKTTGQVQLWSSLRGALWVAASNFGVKTECCAVGTLKKYASGFGGADKGGMGYALAKQNPRFKIEGKKIRDTETGQILDDNAVDAIHLLKWGRELTQNLR